MNVFEQIIANISEPSKMTLCDVEKIRKMRQKFPAAPDDYFEFMRIVGWGDIGGMMIYSGLIKPDPLLAFMGIPDAQIVIFGDDWQGTRYGFDLDNGGELIEITPESEIEGVDGDFIDLMKRYAN